MKKFIILFFLSFTLFSQVNTFRFWSYFNLNIPVSKDINWTILPGIRYEFLREGTEPKNFYMFEFFTGITPSINIRGINAKFPIYYYYTCFLESENYHVHSFEFLPSFQKRFGNFVLSERTIFHNRFYSSFYDDKTGYSLLVRELLQIKYLLGKYGIGLGIEPFYGVIEDASHTPSPLGFTPKGLNLNRINAGIDYNLFRNLILSLNYVFETTYSGGNLTAKNHYVFLNVFYVLKIFP